tara:strand:- start:91 stop:444 length:354 start_codon:yes stop_codon:yes gene_type:complete
MRINWVTTLIAVCISLLLTYSFYLFIPIEKNTLLHQATSAISLIFFLITFVLTIGVAFEESRTTTVVRTTSLVFLFIGLITLSMLSYLSNSVPLLIIIMGMLILVYLLILYALYNAE